MFKSTIQLLGAFAFFAMFTMMSCGDSNTKQAANGIENSIPVDASMVMLINTKQLMEKADMNALKETAFYKDMLSEFEEKSPEAKVFFEDPSSAGFDLGSNLGFFIDVPTTYEKITDINVAFIMPVADLAKVEATLGKIMEKNPDYKIEEQDGYKKVVLKDNNQIVYNDKLLAITNISDAAKVQSIVNPSGENIRSNDNFNKHFKEGKDILFWTHADNMIAAALKESKADGKITGALAMAQLSEDILKNNYMSAYYDFKNGEIDAGTYFDFSDALVDEMGDLMAEKLAVDYSKYLPQDNMGMAMSFGINPSGILNFVAKRGFDKMADNMLQNFKLSLEDIKNGITGDMAVAVYPSEEEGATPAGLFALGVKDKAFVQGLIDNFGALAGMVKDGDNYVMMGGKSMDDPDAEPNKIILNLQDDALLVSNSMDLINQSLAGGSNEVVATMQEGWMGMYINYELLKKHQGAFADDVLDPSSQAISKMLNEYNELKDIKVLCNGSNIEARTSLATQDINSLKRLIEIANEMYKNKEKLMEEFEKSMEMEDEFEGFEEEFDEQT